MDRDQDKGMNRREFIRKAAITGAVAWAVPAIQTVAATPAYAQTNGTLPCVHSPGGMGELNCKDACAAAAARDCEPDRECGGGCEGICAACTGGGENPCPNTNYCNPDCFDVTDCRGSCTVLFTCAP